MAYNYNTPPKHPDFAAMPSASDSVSSFLDHARDARLLPPDQLDDLIRRPDVPQHNLAELCDFLRKSGVLTPFQADRVRSGRGRDLHFAGYTIVDELGPCPGGTAYRALHPSLRTPLILRRVRVDWLAPDNLAAYIGRARDASPVSHPNLAHLLDAGAYQDEPFVVLEPFDGADLATLIQDIGPMPIAMACAVARQAAAGLEAAHDRGLAHGDVRPANLFIGPLVALSRTRPDGSPLSRPAADAAVKVFELGLVPRRPTSGLPSDVLTFLPPESHASPGPTAAGDVYGLGASLFFFLTARPPATAANTPVALRELRPDLPEDLAAVVREMMAPLPGQSPVDGRRRRRDCSRSPRPPRRRLRRRTRPRPTYWAAGPRPRHCPTTSPRSRPPSRTRSRSRPYAPAEPDGWIVTPYTGPDQSGAAGLRGRGGSGHRFRRARRPVRPGLGGHGPPAAPAASPAGGLMSKNARFWFLVGAGLWLLTIPLWIILLSQGGCFGDSQQSSAPKKYRDKPR